VAKSFAPARLRAWIATVVVVPLIVLAIAAVIALRSIERRALDAELRSRGSDMTAAVAQMIAASLRREMSTGAYAAALAQWTAVRDVRRNLVFIRIASTRPDLSYTWANPQLSALVRPPNTKTHQEPLLDEWGAPILDEQKKPKFVDRVEYLHIYNVRAALRDPSHAGLGTLDLGISRLGAEQELQRLTTAAAVVATLFIVAAAFSGVLLARRISGPIERLEEAVVAFGRNESVAELPAAEGSREVRQLTTAFNRMAVELKEKERMALELRAARELQEQLFPRRQFEGYRCRAILESRPANEVGGDFYTEIRWPSANDPWIELALGDVSGKGMGAALLAATTHGILSSFRSNAAEQPDLVSQLQHANSVLLSQAGSKRKDARRRSDFVALLLVALDVGSGNGFFVNCGQIPPVIIGERGARLAVDGSFLGDPPLGILSNLNLHVRTFQLQPDETLVLVSDGVVEAMNPAYEPLGFDRLLSIDSNGTLELEAEHRAMFHLIESHAAGAPQHDDATVVMIRRTA
jgi:serine phosphatase RsbU (regulator of sigma subunit)